jgi:hypothetical protein
MTLYTIEVEGTPVVVLTAEDRRELAEIEDDLTILEDESGNPVWDGASELSVREAFPEEVDRWEAEIASALLTGDACEEDREDLAVFLIKLRDPTDIGDAGLPH